MTTRLDRSHTPMPRTIQHNLIAYMRLFGGLSGVGMVDDPDTFWIVSGSSAPGNAILHTDWAEQGIEHRIDALFAQVGQHIDQIDWFVFPASQRQDLGARLAARGMPGGPGGNWLWLYLTTLSAPPPVSGNFRIEQVRDDAAMRDWLHVSEAGFGASFPRFYDAYARHGYGADAFSFHYIGYLEDVPVTSATLLDAGGGASIYDLSTPPPFRGHGFGGALTHFLLRETLRRGYPETWIWSSDMARTLYRSLGFLDADFGIREHTWHRP